ncbi:MAG: alpha-glucosidase/alpha-galactosidase [Armatimonadota bacterium]|nr:MAG: alpha-glucosidase/alpha-galactosidase [Armatimonadota bacterium]
MAKTPKIAMIGAGSVVFAQHLLGDIMSWPELSEPHIALMDIDPDRLAVAERMAHKLAEALGARPKITAHRTRKPALDGADYVINTIQVGGFPATKIDFEVPSKYGLQQTIADTNGIGGIFRALRTMPVMVKIAQEMETLCPKAIFINYANPMAMVCWAVTRATSIQTVGLCHSVQGTAMQLARYMGLAYEELLYRAAGINHMNFYLKLEYRGRDAYPRLRRAMQDPEIWKRDPVRFEVFNRLGYFVSESSVHFSEYVPWFIRRDRPDLIDRYGISIDEYIKRCIEQDKDWQRTKRSMFSDKPIEVHRSHEYCGYILHAHQTGEPYVIYGNVPNDGIVTNLPQRCSVEVPCLVDRNGIQPCYVGDLPPQLAAIIRNTVNVHELTLEGFFERKRDHIYQAAILDPHASAELTLDEIYSLVDDLFEAHGKMVPSLK